MKKVWSLVSLCIFAVGCNETKTEKVVEVQTEVETVTEIETVQVKVVETIEENDISFYTDVEDSVVKGTKAVSAVVLISSNVTGGAGTGFIVSKDGVVITNNHVLGSGSCVVEGCFVTISKNFQKGTKVQRMAVYAQPLHIDRVTDIAIYQLYKTMRTAPYRMGKTNIKLETPEYLTMSQQTPTEILAKSPDVRTIGHPMAALKKYTELRVLSADSQNLLIGGAIMSGQSGSPLLNNENEVIGVVKTSSIAFTGLSKNGLNVRGQVAHIGEVTRIFEQVDGELKFKAGEKGVLTELFSIKSPTLAEEWYRNIHYYAMNQSFPVDITLDGDADSVSATLLSRCEKYVELQAGGNISAEVASQSDVSMADCFSISQFMSCQPVMMKQFWIHSFCPSKEQLEKLSGLYLKLFEYGYQNTGSLNWNLLQRAASMDPTLSYSELFIANLEKFQPPLDFPLAFQLLSFQAKNGVKKPSYNGVDLIEKFVNFKDDASYPFFAMQIINAHIIMNQAKLKNISPLPVFEFFVDSPDVSLESKFRLEKFAYQMAN